MKIFLLKDKDEKNEIDMIITTETTNKEELQNIISEAKKVDDFTVNVIERMLPADCKSYRSWTYDDLYY